MRYQEVVACPFCGDESGQWDIGLQPLPSDQSEIWKRDETRYSICRCGGAFQNPMPTDASLANFYRQEYRVICPVRNGEWARAKWVFPYLPPDPGEMLDVGCSEGELMKLAKGVGWRVTGVEPNRDVAQRDNGLGLIYRTLEEVCGTFDLVTAIHVLEHVPGPIPFLRQMMSHLRPGGEMLIVVPKNSYRPPHLLGMAESQVRPLFERVGLTITMLETVETKTDAKADIIVRAH